MKRNRFVQLTGGTKVRSPDMKVQSRLAVAARAQRDRDDRTVDDWVGAGQHGPKGPSKVRVNATFFTRPGHPGRRPFPPLPPLPTTLSSPGFRAGVARTIL